MAVETTDILTVKPNTVLPGDNSNGGRISFADAGDDVIHDLIDSITAAQREAGATLWYKAFKRIANVDSLSVADSWLYLADVLTSTDMTARLAAGTFTDTEADISSPRLYGAGTLDTAVLAGDSAIIVNTIDGAADTIFQVGDWVAITDLADDSDATGHIEFHQIATAGVSWAGDQATINIDGTLKYAYATSRSVSGATVKTRIASCIKVAGIAGVVSNLVKTSANGTVDNTGANAIVVHGIGGPTQNITYDFTSSTAFTITGDTLGSLGTGNITTTTAPNNAAVGYPYYTNPAGFWGGTWLTGDRVTFRIDPPALPFWIRLKIPAGAGPVSIERVKTWLSYYRASV
jgi:hypothetical protein